MSGLNEGGFLSEAAAKFEPDLEQAARFIEALSGVDGWNSDVTWQTFDDVKERRRARRTLAEPDPLAMILEGALIDHALTLSTLNRRGAGVFVTVNGTDGRGRKTANVTHVRAYFVDADGVEPDVTALPPSMTVRSMAGPHHYWLARPGEALPRFKARQKALASALGTDQAVCDLARVMRVPGFAHQKAGEPFRVELLECHPRRKFDANALMAAFKAPIFEIDSDRQTPQAEHPRVQQVLNSLRDVSGRDGQWQALCPAHDDNRPSLSISVEADRILICCHAGCEFDEIVASMGMQPSDFFLGTDQIFVYRNKLGEPVARIVRRRGKRYVAEHPDGDAGWRRGVKGIRLPIYRLPDVLARPQDMVVIVEGERDADRLANDGLLASTAPFGAGKWRPHHSNYLRGRDVLIIPDNDEAGRKHATMVSSSLRGVARSVRVLELPGLARGGDVSDWLEDGHTIDELQDLFVTRPATSAVTARSVWQTPWAQTLLERGSDVEMAQEAATWLADDQTPAVFSDGVLWQWDGKSFVRIDEQRLRRKLHEFDGAYYSTDGGVGKVKLSKSKLDSIRREVETILATPDFFRGVPQGFACDSGFISFDDNGLPTLKPHSPSQRSRFVVPGDWSPTPRRLPMTLLMRLLNGSFGGDPDRRAKTILMVELLGVVALGLGTRLSRPQAIIFYGPSAENGKSVILELLKGMVPPNAVSALPVTAFGSRRMVVFLAGRHLNVSDELPGTQTVASDNFKAIVTGEEIVGRDVYRPMLQFRPVAQHVFATNTLPGFRGGMDRGVLRRLLPVSFNRRVPIGEQIPHLAERILEEERDALLAFAVMGAGRILRRMRFTEPPSSRRLLEEWALQDDVVQLFLAERVDVLLGTQAPWTQSDELYAAFRLFADETGFERREIPTKPVFSRKVRQLVPGAEAIRRGGKRGLLGLRLRGPHSASIRPRRLAKRS